MDVEHSNENDINDRSTPDAEALRQLWHELERGAPPGSSRLVVLVEKSEASTAKVHLQVLRLPEREWQRLSSYEDIAPGRASASDLSESASLATLREHLRREPRASLRELARELGMSMRTLQRALSGAGTTLSAERDRLRKARIMELLRHPEVKLDAIAADVACSDRRGLNRLFRRVSGESPSQFRRRVRGRPGTERVL